MVDLQSPALNHAVQLTKTALCAALLGVLAPPSPIMGAPEPAAVLAISPPASVAASMVDPRWIRVAVSRKQSQVELAVSGHFRIVALHTAEELREGRRLSRVAVRAVPEGIQVGQQIFPLFGVRIEPIRAASVSLNGQRLRGTLEILRQEDVTLLVINHVSLEDYLQGVLSKEAPHHWPLEALRALAIAARTYAVYQRLAKTSIEYDVTSDVLSQLYGGKSAEKRRTTRAVNDTAGLVLTSAGRIFPTFYHSTCGGMTESASVMGPYTMRPLQGGVSCSFCRASPFYQWQRRLTKEDVAWAVKQGGRGSIWPVEDLQVLSQTPSGRVHKLRIRGATRTLDLSGVAFRELLGFERLRSTLFTISPEPGGFMLEGRGWGHGVGLCQWGTAELARHGLVAHEILGVYYPTAELMRLEDSLLPVDTQGRP